MMAIVMMSMIIPGGVVFRSEAVESAIVIITDWDGWPPRRRPTGTAGPARRGGCSQTDRSSSDGADGIVQCHWRTR